MSGLETAHQDGWRVVLEEEPQQHAVYVQLHVDGQPTEKHRLCTFEIGQQRHLSYLAACRYAKMATAVTRFVNEGGALIDVYMLFNLLDQLDTKIEVPWTVVAIDSDEVHVRTYKLQDGNYLRVIEDEVSEQLTPEELLEYLAATDELDG